MPAHVARQKTRILIVIAARRRADDELHLAAAIKILNGVGVRDRRRRKGDGSETTE
jgi:hypothetical protein